jgi:lipoprotein-anchoring transpeptidase ErfK/SrfK
VSAHQVSISAGRHQPITGKVFCGVDLTRSRSLLRVSVLTAAGLFGVSSCAEAATSIFWSDSDPGVTRAVRPQPKRRAKAHRNPASKLENQEKLAAKPQGPLIISVSIDQQKLRVYDANGFFAETPISTGMRGHPTPMGVFSIIQKHKFHRSNIYSGAPMPYMQRITWSGVAMHAGVLPGYPASHGCIRMPMAFAVKMWGWTKMGARVIVTPGEITPSSFSHPLLIAKKPEPVAETPVASLAPKPETTPPKSNLAAAAETPVNPTVGAGHAELRSSIMLDSPKAESADAPSATPRDQVRTADASATLTEHANTLTDAGLSDANVPARPAAAEAATATITKADDFAAESASDTKPGAAAGKDTAITASDSRLSDSVAIAATETKTDDKPVASSTDTSASSKSTAKPDSDGTATGVTAAPDPRKDQTRASDADKPAGKPDPAAAPAPKRSGQIAVFVSRKDSKIYVRQNLTPLFDAPVAIAPGDRPLGTHVFTAQADKDDSFRWSVVSLPTTARQAELRDGDERASRRRKAVGAVETKSIPLPSSAAEALDRLTIPADAMTRIADALSTGGSLVVSDQGIAAGETGEGTDFIIRLR